MVQKEVCEEECVKAMCEKVLHMRPGSNVRCNNVGAGVGPVGIMCAHSRNTSSAQLVMGMACGPTTSQQRREGVCVGSGRAVAYGGAKCVGVCVWQGRRSG